MVDIIGVKDDPSLETLNGIGGQGTSCGMPCNLKMDVRESSRSSRKVVTSLGTICRRAKPTQTSSGLCVIPSAFMFLSTHEDCINLMSIAE